MLPLSLYKLCLNRPEDVTEIIFIPREATSKKSTERIALMRHKGMGFRSWLKINS